jgi:hypothetical protein
MKYMLSKLLFAVILFYPIIGVSEYSLSIHGKWQANQDAKSVLVITRTNYIEIYDRDTVYSGSYQYSHNSCDTTYMTNKKLGNLDFIKIEDGRCFEITGLSSKILAIRYTQSGKLLVFHRVRFP